MKTITQLTTRKAALLVTLSLFSVIYTSGLNPDQALNQSYETVNPTTETNKAVVYGAFTATVTNKSVCINWETVSENNNNYFEVERSADMQEFKTVAIILDGFSTEGTGKSYAFKEGNDVIKNGQIVYYRLKQFSRDGNVTYSKVIKVQFDNTKNTIIPVSSK